VSLDATAQAVEHLAGALMFERDPDLVQDAQGRFLYLS
jgi:hypothetical protein